MIFCKGIKGNNGPFEEWTSRGTTFKAKHTETPRRMNFQGKGNPWRLQSKLAPSLLAKNFIGGLTVAPHGDGCSLEESRNQR